jgi:tetratricopeptide (TPR) repeat protein
MQGLANSLAFLSGQYVLVGRVKEAVAVAERALNFSDKVENLGFETQAYGGLSTAYYLLGNKRKSEEYGKLAQTRIQRGLIASVMTGTDKNDFKDFEDQLAFEISRQNTGGEALARFNLGNAYFAKNDLPKALSYWQPAVPLYQKLEEKWLYLGSTLRSIGKALDSLDRHEEAVKSWRAAANVFISHQNYPMALDSLDNLVQSYYGQGMYSEAGATLDEALGQRQRAGLMADGDDELDLSININMRLDLKTKAGTRCLQLVQVCRAKGDDQCVAGANRILSQLAAN